MIPINGLKPKQYSITQEGMRELQRQLQGLKQQRKEVADELHDITSQSTDLGAHEDSTFAMNQAKAITIDGEIELLERIIGLAHVIEKPKTNDVVQLGSRVCVDLDGKEHCYVIVGAVEANPANNKISDESPLGQSMLNRKINDRFEIVSPGGQHMMATVIRIE